MFPAIRSVAVWLSLVGVFIPHQPSRAQLEARQTTRPSPHESITRTVGGAEITIVYGRPFMRGRQIFGALVPYGRVWCPGADEATTLNSTKPLEIGGLLIPPGPHTIWVLPTADRWTLIVSKDPEGFHNRYYPDRDLGRVEVSKYMLQSPVEQLTFDVIDTPGSGQGTLSMSWENIEITAPIHVQ